MAKEPLQIHSCSVGVIPGPQSAAAFRRLARGSNEPTRGIIGTRLFPIGAPGYDAGPGIISSAARVAEGEVTRSAA